MYILTQDQIEAFEQSSEYHDFMVTGQKWPIQTYVAKTFKMVDRETQRLLVNQLYNS